MPKKKSLTNMHKNYLKHDTFQNNSTLIQVGGIVWFNYFIISRKQKEKVSEWNKTWKYIKCSKNTQITSRDLKHSTYRRKKNKTKKKNWLIHVNMTGDLKKRQQSSMQLVLTTNIFSMPGHGNKWVNNDTKVILTLTFCKERDKRHH